MAKYQKYAEYKDSGVDWLSEIPSHWDVASLRFCFIDIKNGSTANQVEEDSETLPISRIESISTGEINYEKVGYVSRKSIGENFKISQGDILLSHINSLSMVGNVALKRDNALLYHGMNLLRLIPKKDKFDPKYLFWILKTKYFRNAVESIAKPAINQASVSIDSLKNISFLIPLYLEQKKIANFLDYETAQIDTLIAKQEKLIELLKEKRQAVISYAVTKGLDPNVAMKDSGVEWLGEVPEHWRVCRLKHVGYIQSGIAKGKDLKDKISISVPMLRVANVQDGYLNLDEVHQINIEPEQLERYLLQNGDVLMNEGGDNDKLGRGAVWRNEIKNCIHQNHVFAIRTTLIEPEWLDILTRASYAKFHFFRQSKQSTNLASISATNIKETPILVPPKNEREQILSYLNKQFDRFSKLENRCYQQIELLKERRTALISSAVTGKIDVRDWQNPNKNNNQDNMELSA